MDYVAAALFCLGAITAIIGEFMVIIALVKDSKILFVLSILFPPLGLLFFLIFRFPVAWKPASIVGGGLLVAYVGYLMMPEDLQWETGFD